jgi:hypothetical protein
VRAALLLVLSACSAAPPVDPLDPDEVEDAAQGEGDAQGSARGGTYALAVPGEATCDCPEVMGVDLCDADLTRLASGGATVTVTHADGYLTLAPTGAEALLSLSGSLDADGAFDLGGIYDLSSVLGDGELLTRLTGEFTSDDRFTATLRDRVRGAFGDQSVDCRHEVEVMGERVTASDPP